ncbi:MULTISPECIES: lipopolysaccharide biosynthesis protein [Olivibacter]|uniref:Lipopolysaccharide biosynthesis protein n=1 Tax=Olivibacter oleidegradans TaxID=760123 RepID=A0ABV6HGF7_9SPHI|nr:oligosaccharide flippase family protein [Olivibacter sp. LS-1]
MIYGLSTIIARLVNFILTPLFSRKLSTAVFGIFTTMYSYASLLNALLAFGMETTFFRYIQKKEDNKQAVYNNTFLIILAISLCFLLLVLLFKQEIAHFMNISDPDLSRYITYFALILVLDAIAVIPFAKIRADGRPLRYGMIKLFNIFIFVSSNLFFIVFIPWAIKTDLSIAPYFSTWYHPQWVGYVFLSNLIASAVTLLLMIPELLKLKLRFNGPLAREMFSYSFPILIANFSFIINENLDKVFLGQLLPDDIAETQVGIYGLSAKLAVFLSIFIQAFRLGAEPFFFSQAKEKNSGQTYAIIMDYFVIAMAIGMFGLVANIEILKYFIAGSSLTTSMENWKGLSIVPILLLGYIFLGVYMSLSIWYKLSDQTKYGLYISGTGAIVTIVLNLVFIPSYGFIASAWITMITYACMMILSYVLGQKNYPIPYHTFKNLTYIVCAIILSWLSFYVFGRNLIIGNGLLLLFLIGIYLKEGPQLKQLLGYKRR